MTDELKPYPEYKDSGLPWLGRVPEHWDLLRAKYLMREMDTRSKDESGTLLSVSQYSGVTKRRLREGSEDPDMRSSSLVGYKVAKPGNLVSNIMLAWNGSLGISPIEGVVSPAYCVYRICIGEPWFFHHLLRSPAYKAEIKRRSRGVVDSRLRLYTDDFFRIPMLLPNLREQQAIVRFVRDLDEKVRRFILNRRRLIEVLNEQKQAIINRAVTRGLDPNAPLKPSGIDWLGDIPGHWEVVPLKYVSRKIQNGVTPPTNTERYYDQGTIPWYGPSSIGQNRCVSNPVKLVSTEAFSEGKARLIRAPAVLIVVIGATAGRMGLLKEDGATNQQITAFELREDTVRPAFAVEVLRLAEYHLKSTASTATIPILDSGEVARLPVLLPNLEEQDSILHWIENNTVDLISAITRAKREIDLIREYRTRLISDVVTGKVDVRDLAPPPGSEDSEEMAEALEPLEEDIADAVINDEEPINESD